ncbi:DNA topology modulation protein [Streptococcus agalactiae ILRI112]|nr:DNA topology modulation protein [Streptococcus agalactiae ILRI112]
MANGCPEKLDFEFISWILKDGRSDKQKSNYKQVIENYPQKIKILKHQRDLEQYLKELPVASNTDPLKSL